MNISELPNTLTENDIDFTKFIFASHDQCVYLFDKNGVVFEPSFKYMAIEDKKGKPYLDSANVVINYEGLMEYEKSPSENYTACLPDDGDEDKDVFIASREEYNIIPTGDIFDKWKKELLIIDIVSGDSFNKHEMVSYFLKEEEIERHSNKDIERYRNQLLIIHPETYFYVTFNKNKKEQAFKFWGGDTIIYFDSLDISLYFPFIQSLVESGYQ